MMQLTKTVSNISGHLEENVTSMAVTDPTSNHPLSTVGSGLDHQHVFQQQTAPSDGEEIGLTPVVLEDLNQITENSEKLVPMRPVLQF